MPKMFERTIKVICPDHKYDKKMVVRALYRKQLSPKYKGLSGVPDCLYQIKWDMEHKFGCTDYKVEFSDITEVQQIIPIK